MTVVTPRNIEKHMLEKIKHVGAHQTLQYGKDWVQADDFLCKMAKIHPNGIYVAPFDHELIRDGNATIVEEIVHQLKDLTDSTTGSHEQISIFPSAIICSVGGGGLFNGIIRGLDRYAASATTMTEVVAVETVGAASLYQSLLQNRLGNLPLINTAATSLAAPRVCKEAYNNAKRSNVRSVAVPDAYAEARCVILAEKDHVLAELASGVNIALCQRICLEKILHRRIQRDEIVVIVVCGGNDITTEAIVSWKKDFAQDTMDANLLLAELCSVQNCSRTPKL